MERQKLMTVYDESMKNRLEPRRMNLIELIKTLCTSKYFPNICIMLARIVPAQLHNVDIEQLNSANNLLRLLYIII